MVYMLSETNTRQNLMLLAFSAGIVEIVGAVVQATTILRSLGIDSVFQSVSLESADKVNFALYLTFAGATLLFAAWSGSTIYRGGPRLGGLIAGAGSLSGVVVVVLPFLMGYPSSVAGLSATALAAVLMGGVTFMNRKAPGDEARGLLMSPTDIAVVAVFSALTAVLTGTTGLMLPSPTGGYTHVGDTVIYVAALLFGSKVGGLVGVIGPVVADLLVGYPRWFVTVLAHGSQGVIAGLGRRKSTALQVAVLAVSGLVMAGTYFFVNVFIKGYPLAVASFLRDLFGQALVSLILGLFLSKGAEKALPTLLGKE